MPPLFASSLRTTAGLHPTVRAINRLESPAFHLSHTTMACACVNATSHLRYAILHEGGAVTG